MSGGAQERGEEPWTAADPSHRRADRYACDAGAVVTPEALQEKGLVAGGRPVKVLARGDVGKALTVRAHKFSGKAAEKLAAAGGVAESIV